MNILFINAIADDHSVKAIIEAQGNIRVILSGSSNVGSHLAPYLKKDTGGKIEHLTTSMHDERQNIEVTLPDIVFNEVSEPDSHIGALHKVNRLISQLRCPVINPPEAILNTRREALSDKLSSLQTIRVPKTIRIKPASPEQINQIWQMHFSDKAVLIRAAGDHGGCSTLRLTSEQDLSLLHRLPLDGRDYLLSEYLDYVSDDGLYRKYRVVLVDGEIYLRHLIISDHWMIHSGGRIFMENHPELCQEEASNLINFESILSDNVIADLKKINNLIGADYLGLDCNINGDQLTVFELNANMNILVGNKVNNQLCDESIGSIKQALCRLVTRKVNNSIRLF